MVTFKDQPAATVVITTHNRRELLRRSIASVQDQTVPVRLLVMDDASSDGTSEMMPAEFPDIEYYRSDENLGPCFHRNRAIGMAATDIVFGLDDDSMFQSPDTIEQTLAEFDRECIGAVSVPYINILESRDLHRPLPFDAAVYVVHAFEACIYAIRRSVFLETGCFREEFFYMGEESDLCTRMLEKGYFVRLGRAAPIHHFRPPGRVSPKVDMLERRNDVISFYLNTPAALLLPYLTGTVIRGLLHGIRVRRFGNMVKGVSEGLRFVLTNRGMRRPVSISTFLKYRRIKRKGVVRLHEVQDGGVQMIEPEILTD